MESLGQLRGQIRLDVRQAVAAYAALRAQNQRTVYALRGTGDSFMLAGQGAAVAGAGMVYAFGRVVNAAAEYERKMDYFGAVTDTNKGKMQELSKFTLQLAEDTIYSAGEIADGIIELGKAGVDADGVIRGIGEAMANLGAAGDIPLAQSGQIITSTVQQFALAAEDATKVTDLLAGAANASIADISDIGVSLKYVGGVANAAGLTFEDTTTAISLLAKAGIRGSTAGTSLRQMIVSLGGATGPARKSLQELGIITEDGSNKFFTAEGKAKSLSQVFQILQDSTAGLTQKQRLMHLRTIFNNRALSAASILTRDGAKGFKEMNKEMSKVKAADVASARLDNLSGDIEILRGNIETFMIRGGTPFQEVMRQWVQNLTDLIQKFGELDPEMQKFIIQSVGVTGSVLVVMGAMSMFVGLVARFIAASIKMAAGIKFVARMFKILWTNGRWAMILLKGPLIAALAAVAGALGLTVGAFLAIVAVIVALGVGLVVLYKKWAPFRNMVNDVASALWGGIKAIGAFFKTLVTEPEKAWAMIQAGFNNLVSWASGVGEQIGSALGSGLSSIGSFIQGIVTWFQQLPGRVLGVVTGFVTRVRELLTFRNVGYVIGFMVGTVVTWFVTLGARVIASVISLVTRVVAWFQTLPARVGYAIGFLVGFVVSKFINLGIRVIATVISLVTRVVNWFRTLPARVGAAVAMMAARAIAAGQRLAAALPGLAARAVQGVIRFFRNLPGTVIGLMLRMYNGARSALERLRGAAVSLGQGIRDGLLNGIRGLPGAVTGIFGNVVSAIRGVISSAFNAVRDFAAGMWKGFKDGLDINSPSIIEKQMVQMTGVIDDETKKISRRTMDIQGLAKNIAKTRFTLPEDSRNAQGLVALASMHSRNQNRARTLAANSGKQGTAIDARRPAPTNGPGRQKLTITNWHTGEGYMSDIAADTQDEDAYYDNTFERMG